ncbi:hypothetical protein RIM93_34130, partial [Pseudomonas aeruginosa]|nr:hypothetical protein [Pseudomonas aeruginosa]
MPPQLPSNNSTTNTAFAPACTGTPCGTFKRTDPMTEKKASPEFELLQRIDGRWCSTVMATAP